MKVNSSLVIIASALLVASLPVTGAFAKPTKAQCEALYQKADKDGDGTIAQMEDPIWQQRIDHMTDLEKKDLTIITKDQFMTSCMRGEMEGL